MRRGVAGQTEVVVRAEADDRADRQARCGFGWGGPRGSALERRAAAQPVPRGQGGELLGKGLGQGGQHWAEHTTIAVFHVEQPPGWWGVALGVEGAAAEVAPRVRLPRGSWRVGVARPPGRDAGAGIEKGYPAGVVKREAREAMVEPADGGRAGDNRGAGCAGDE